MNNIGNMPLINKQIPYRIWYPLTPARSLKLAEEYKDSPVPHQQRLAKFYSAVPRKIVIDPSKRNTPRYTKVIFDHEL